MNAGESVRGSKLISDAYPISRVLWFQFTRDMRIKLGMEQHTPVSSILMLVHQLLRDLRSLAKHPQPNFLPQSFLQQSLEYNVKPTRRIRVDDDTVRATWAMFSGL